MLKNITLSAEKGLILKARERATRERSSLNSAFRQWLQRYAGGDGAGDEFNKIMDRLNHITSGKTFSRDEMNER